MSEEIIMYIVVNSDLNMSKGKTASQVAHAACDVVSYLIKHPTTLYNYWSKNGQAKIILRANTEQMEYLVDLFNNRHQNVWCCSIRDAGKTEVSEGSLTAIAFIPNKRRDVPEIIRKLKLL